MMFLTNTYTISVRETGEVLGTIVADCEVAAMEAWIEKHGKHTIFELQATL